MTKPIFSGSEWTAHTIQDLYEACAEIAINELKLDVYPNQFEICSSEQMLDAYSSIGMPVYYNHWSFGKHFISHDRQYRNGDAGLAMELVINSTPCINYLLEDNTATVQALVIAHAAFGHNAFFKNNYLFKEWTDATSIVDYLLFAKNYIKDCEERYGAEEVELFLDSCHALSDYGIDKYKRPPKPAADVERARQKEREEFVQKNLNVLFSNPLFKSNATNAIDKFPAEPVENILKFIEKNSPVLQTWQREIIRIVRMISQYFHPQRLTKVMNEGFACWTHDTILNRLYDKGLITEGSMLEYYKINSAVLYQSEYKSKYYSGFNPYALGYKMFKDIERICKKPTDEDRDWFPNIAGKSGEYLDIIKDAVANYRDESFIRQFLSPKLMRDFKLFRIVDEDKDFWKVSDIHNETGYKEIRKSLASSYDLNNSIPDIQIVNANIKTDRSLDLLHKSIGNRKLKQYEAVECLKHMKRLWGFPVTLTSVNEYGATIDKFIGP